MIFRLPKIYHNFDGFDALASLYEQTKEDIFDDIVIDMQATKKSLIQPRIANYRAYQVDWD